MKDYLIKAIGFNRSARIYCVSITNTLNEIGNRFSYYPSALDAMGRTLSMGSIMGSMLKGDESVTIRVEGNGQIGKIIVDADAKGNIRGYAQNPYCHFEYNDGRLNVRQTVGQIGYISIIKDLKLKEHFVGSIPIISGELAEDFAYYYSVSEQIPTAVSLGCVVNTDAIATSAGGFIIQLLPNTPEETIIEIEKRLKLLPPVSEMFESSLTPEKIIINIDPDCIILEKLDINFKCGCSKERFERGIISLGLNEIEDIIQKDHQIETVCHFCGQHYYFNEQELQKIAIEAKEKEISKKQN